MCSWEENRTMAASKSEIKLVSFMTKLIRYLPPIVENWPNESSEATFIPFSSVVTWVTWSCRFLHDSVSLIIRGGGGGIFGRGSLSGGIAPLLKSLLCVACLEVLWKARSDLQPWNMGTRLLPAILVRLRIAGTACFSGYFHTGRRYVV